LLVRLDDKAVIHWMIDYYCKKHHKSDSICEECSAVLEYALKRIEKCPYGRTKPVCSNCSIHCYKIEMRQRIKIIMKFSGPVIIFRKPVIGIKYLLKKKMYRPEKLKNP